LSTWSRSTSTKICGTVGRKVVETPTSSGRFRAASMNLVVFSARKAISLPARSWSMKVAPPDGADPGMAGRREGECDGTGMYRAFS
jgi:hypothetical protein